MDLTQATAETLLQQFKAALRNEDIPAAEQMELMQVTCLSGEELQLACISEINLAYGKASGALFREYCTKQTGIPNLRVTAIIDETARKEVVREKVLSKLEIFELMAEKNPALKMLKNSLHLNVDF